MIYLMIKTAATNNLDKENSNLIRPEGNDVPISIFLLLIKDLGYGPVGDL